jgi:hypothetical protein
LSGSGLVLVTNRLIAPGSKQGFDALASQHRHPRHLLKGNTNPNRASICLYGDSRGTIITPTVGIILRTVSQAPTSGTLVRRGAGISRR